MAVRAFTMPKWGIEMREGTLAEWLVSEGQAFNKGDTLALIETDKITNEVEAEFPSILHRIVTPAGETQPVGALLAIFADEDASEEEIAAVAAKFQVADARPAEAPAPAVAPVEEPAPAATVELPDDLAISPQARAHAQRLGIDAAAISGSGRGGRITFQDVDQAGRASGTIQPRGPVNVDTSALDGHFASPLAKRLAAIHDLDLGGIAGSGPRGRISRADVEAVLPGVAVANDAEVLPMSAIRKVIARRLTEAKQSIPHFYLRAEVGVDALSALRRTANLVLGAKASINDYLIRAVALALLEVPDVNIQVHGTDIHRFPGADISVAVATERGLVTPILRRADRMQVSEISEAVRALVAKAQAGRLAMDEIEGGSFTISNLGMFGIHQFDAIINPPQGAILAVGTTRRVWGEGPDGQGRFESRIALSLSCDHRAIDGATGARFLKALKAIIEAPERLFAR